jgi:pimeloyl-ACP methyl ester carboxylesterase
MKKDPHKRRKKMIFLIIGIIIGSIVLYLSMVTFLPGFEVPKQALEIAKGPAKETEGPKPSWSRKDVHFEIKGMSLRAWLYLPEDLSSPVPCIIMANGTGGTKDMLLEHYAGRYQEAGFAVLAFDYRHFGESDGEPRQLLWIPYQLEDYLAAIQYARGLKEINPARIALWGTSLSGGHVIVTAAKDQNIACVCAQCPGLDGRASAKMAFERLGIRFLLRMLVHGQRDFFRSWFNLSPHKIPIVGKPGSLALMNTPDAYDFLTENRPENFINEACARILLRGDKYRPVKHAQYVRCPVLLQVCDHDSIIPRSAAEETEKQLGTYAEAIYYPIGHFDIYTGDHYEKAVTDQLAFFRKHLGS